MNEEWRPIKDFPDYAVSSLGRIKRMTDSGNNRKSGFILKSSPCRGGYRQIMLYREGKIFPKMVHRLVLEHFVGYPPFPESEGNHKNGIKWKNNLENLEWLSPSENKIHAHQTGLASGVKGERNNLSKLKEGEVYLIKKLLARKILKHKFIAKMFRINRATISYIAEGKTWKNITYP